MRKRFGHVIALLSVLALVLAACTATEATTTTGENRPPSTNTPGPDPITDDGIDAATGLPVIAPIDYSGDIVAMGSSTVFPLSEVVANEWIDEGGPNITIDSIGSGAGFERFCETGESDISNASRPIREEEVSSCESIGRIPIEFRVGTDALAITVSAKNYFATDITLAELAVLFSTAQTWQDVRAEWPAHPVAVFSPGTDSGTFDYFVEEVFDEDDAPILGSGAQFSEDDNVLVTGIAGDACTEGDASSTCAVGYFGFAYFVENEDVLTALSVEGVEPNAANVDAGAYPLSRPLFMYSDAGIMADKPQVAAFLTYYLNNVSRLIADVGYFPAPAADMQSGVDALKEYWDSAG
ncbi:MAG: substrate-binding domain-containing protein [Acidimicrobiia bacterium]|nr:substrate-binding domain-containing protein [Acidimicrobiia bacterium]